MSNWGKLYNGFISINAKDLSTKCQSAQITIGKEVFDLSVMGNAAKVRSAIGLEDHSIQASFLFDVATDMSYLTLYGLWYAGTAQNVVFRLDSAVASGSNPQFTIPCILDGGKLPIGGKHGDLLKLDVNLISAGALTYTTA
jgi:hypothetical protein